MNKENNFSEIAQALKPLTDRVRTDVTATKNKDGVSIWTDQSLTFARMVAHIENKKARGVCPIREGQNTTAVALLDLDSHKGETPWQDMLKVAREIAYHAQDFYGLKAVPFSSSGGRGIHLYFMWDEQQDAYSVRRTLVMLLDDLGYSNGTAGVAAKQIEVFPKQDAVPPGGYGNQFILPLFNKSVPLDLSRGELPKDAVLKSDWWTVSRPIDLIEKPVRAPQKMPEGELAKWVPFVFAVDPDCAYDEWLRIGMALHFESGGDVEALALWDEWSSHGKKYPGFEKLENRWNGFGGKDSQVTGGTIEAIAREHGYVQDIIDSFDIITGDDKKIDTAADDSDADKDPRLPSNVVEMASRKPVGGALPRFTRNSDSQIEATLHNLKLALSRPDICGIELRHDEFTDNTIISIGGGKWRLIRDNDLTHVRLTLERKGFRPIGRELMRDALGHEADENKFDSAIAWLNGLPEWDGVQRIDTFMAEYFGCPDNDYSRSLGAYIWTGLAGRVLSPGCQLDIVPIFVGAQGLRKSTAVKLMAPESDWFCEVSLAKKDEDQARLMRGKVIGELAELNGLKTKEMEAIKAFITRRYEQWVPKFKEFATNFARRLMLIGTTNKDEFLRDETGHRRMAPIRVQRADTERLAADREQLWAEGKARYLAKGIAWQDVERLAALEHDQYVVGDMWADHIAKYLDRPEMDNTLPLDKGYLTMAEIFAQALSMSPDRVKPRDEHRLAEVLIRMGFVRSRPRALKRATVWVMEHSPTAGTVNGTAEAQEDVPIYKLV